jgi:hypothetical protein
MSDERRTRRLQALALGWGVVTLLLLWLFARNYRF